MPNPVINRRMASSAASGAAGSGLLSGLAAYWKLDAAPANVTPDSTANAFDLTFQGVGPLNFGVPGKINNGFEPSSFNDGVARPFTSALSSGASGTSSFTFSIWVNFNNVSGFPPCVASYERDTANNNFLLYVDASGKFTFYTNDNSSTIVLIHGLLTPGNGSWFHIVCGFDAANSQIFIQDNNGARQTIATSSIKHTSIPFVIGNWSDFKSAAGATLDECGFWNRVLSTAEVTQLYNGGAGLAYPFS